MSLLFQHIKCIIGDTFWRPDGITWNPLTDDSDALRLQNQLTGIIHLFKRTDFPSFVDSIAFFASMQAFRVNINLNRASKMGQIHPVLQAAL